jgi:hypothetical protein
MKPSGPAGGGVRALVPAVLLLPVVLLTRMPKVGGRLAVVAGARALAVPYRGRPQYAAQLSGAGQIAAVPRPQGEVLVVAGQATDLWPAARTGEAVVRVRPGSGLLRVEPSCTDALG